MKLRRYSAALAICLLLFAAGPLSAGLLAGASKFTVTPDLAKFQPVYLAGFGHNRQATSVHDDLFARCLALAKPAATPLVLCGVDSIGLFWDDVVKIRAAAVRKLGRPADVVVAALHDHQSPDTMGLWGLNSSVSGIGEDYNAYVIDRTAEAVAEAVRNLVPAKLTLAQAHPAELDTFIDDDRPPDVHDASVIALSASTPSGKPIATLVNWANHPETLGSKNTAITADYSGYLVRELESRLGGVAVFLNGAVGGMQSPLGAKVTDPQTGAPAPADSFRKAEIIGTRVADIAADAVGQAAVAAIDDYQSREQLVRIPVANRGFHLAAAAGLYKGRKAMAADGTTEAPVGLIRLLHRKRPLLEIARVPGELYPELSVGGIERYPGADFPEAPAEPPIKSMMKAPYRMLIGLACDEIGYIIPQAEWDDTAPWLQNAPSRWYGEVNSTGPLTASLIARALQRLFDSR